MIDYPDRDPADERPVVGLILHPAALASLRKLAAMLRVELPSVSRYEILGSSTGVPVDRPLLVYELEPALLQLERDGHPLQSLG